MTFVLSLFVNIVLATFFLSLFPRITIPVWFISSLFFINYAIVAYFIIEMLFLRVVSLNKPIWIVIMTFPIGWIIYFSFGRKKVIKNKKYYKNYMKNIAANGYFSEWNCNIEKSQYYPDVVDYYRDLLDEIEHAQKDIYMQMFILKDDFVAARFSHALEIALENNVNVHILIDDFGITNPAFDNVLSPLVSKGAKITIIDPVHSTKWHSQAINYRNHIKQIIIDEKVMYFGGANIASEYVSLNYYYALWKDANVRVTGDIIGYALEYYEFIWNSYSKEKIYLERLSSDKERNTKAIYSSPTHQFNFLRGEYERLINKAEKELIIETPYLAVDRAFLGQLIKKAKAGVDIHIIVPGEHDGKYFAYDILRWNAEKLSKNGIKVHLLDNRFLHSKLISVDKKIAGIGTVNMDNRSFYLNDEMMVLSTEKNLVKSIRKDMEQNMKHSTVFDYRRFKPSPITRAKFRLYSFFYYFM